MFIKNIWRYITIPFAGLSFLYGARRTRKWIKKNNKMQDPNYHDYQKRWEYMVKKASSLSKALGIKIEEVNEDYKPKGTFLLIANHTSNLDSLITIATMGNKTPITSIAKNSLLESPMKGYMQASESFLVFPRNPRKSLINFNKAGEWAKKNKRGVVVFPEGKRNWDGIMSEFSAASFKLSQRNYLPIHVVSLVGVMESTKWYQFKPHTVKVIYHKPIKASEAAKVSTHNLATKAQTMIQKDLDEYYKGLSEKKLEKVIKQREKRRSGQDKYEAKIEAKKQKEAEKEARKKAKETPKLKDNNED